MKIFKTATLIILTLTASLCTAGVSGNSVPVSAAPEVAVTDIPNDSYVNIVDLLANDSKFQRILKTTQLVSGSIFTVLVILMLILSNIDHRHPRKLSETEPVTIVVPCYNDGDSVTDTVVSIYRTIKPEFVEVIVINDASKDNSLEKIKEIQKTYPIRIVNNEKNKGKARSLNDTIPSAKNELVLCLDADTLLNKRALTDMVARMKADPRLGAVSCPYRPRNKGFLPILQAVEYSMLLLTQGAHNLTSAMALWGGCLMVRKTAFHEVGGFYLNAITEDVDMAFRLNRKKWRVEQSFCAVRSLVPQRLKAWVRQKLRWTSGGTQCYFRHIRVWIKNPIQIFFILSYSFLVASTIPALFDKIEIVQSFNHTWSMEQSFWQNFIVVNKSALSDILRRLSGIALCYIPPFIYNVPMHHRSRDIWTFVLVNPFSVF